MLHMALEPRALSVGARLRRLAAQRGFDKPSKKRRDRFDVALLQTLGANSSKKMGLRGFPASHTPKKRSAGKPILGKKSGLGLC